MTIFDFKPYSHWKHLWTVAYVNWDTGMGDTPRTVIKVELLRLVNERQRRQIEELARQYSLLYTKYGELLEEHLELFALSDAVSRLVTLTAQNAPNSCETHVLRPDTPASTPTHEIEPLASATDDVVRLRLHPAMAEPLIFIESE